MRFSDNHGGSNRTGYALPLRANGSRTLEPSPLPSCSASEYPWPGAAEQPTAHQGSRTRLETKLDVFCIAAELSRLVEKFHSSGTQVPFLVALAKGDQMQLDAVRPQTATSSCPAYRFARGTRVTRMRRILPLKVASRVRTMNLGTQEGC
jgi:hypothetical protein